MRTDFVHKLAGLALMSMSFWALKVPAYGGALPNFPLRTVTVSENNCNPPRFGNGLLSK